LIQRAPSELDVRGMTIDDTLPLKEGGEGVTLVEIAG